MKLEIDQNFIEKLKANFAELSHMLNIKYMAEGEENWIYKVTTSDNVYVIRVSKSAREDADFDFEYRYSQFLQSKSIPVAKQYTTKEGKLFLNEALDTVQHRICLFDFIEGKVIQKPSKLQIIEAAKLLAQIHSNSQKFDIDFDRLGNTDHLYWLSDLKPGTEMTDNLVKVYDIYKSLAEEIRSELAEIPKYPLHNDIYFNNLLYVDDKIQGLIDFDECHKHYIECELGWSMNKICNFGSFDNYLDNIHIFLAEYSKWFTLDKEQMNLTFKVLFCEGMRSYYRYLIRAISSDDIQYYSNILELYESKGLLKIDDL